MGCENGERVVGRAKLRQRRTHQSGRKASGTTLCLPSINFIPHYSIKLRVVKKIK
jgi:hypothetical protein